LIDATNWLNGFLIQTNSNGSAPTTGTLSSANNNIGIGADVLKAITSGDNGIYFGGETGVGITSGSSNIAIGCRSMNATVGSGTQNNNVAIGHKSMEGILDGANANVAVGYQSMKNSSFSGDDNVAVGEEAGSSLTSGSKNLLLGVGSGNITTGSSNTIIGYGGGSSATGDHQLEITSGGSVGTVTWLTGESDGGVTVSEAYKLPTAVTGANDYVLTAQTDGSTAWAAAGGGGGGIGIVYPPVGNSQSSALIHWGHISAPFGTSNQTTQSFSTDSPCWIPIIARRTATFTDIAIYVTSGVGSTSNVDLGIYSDDSGEPGTLLGQATVDVDTSGQKSATLVAEAGESLASVAGTQYWLAMVRQAGVGTFTMQAANKGDVGQWAWTAYATSYGIIVQSGSDNTLPASATFTSGFAWNTLAIGVDYE